MKKAPYLSEYTNAVQSMVYPNVVHSRNTYIFSMYVKYLLQKLISVYKFKLPEDWDPNYFKYVLIGLGYISVFNTDKYGVICQECTLGDRISLYKQPTRAIVSNPLFQRTYDLKIGQDCEIIKLQPDYSSPLDIVSTYADLMTLALETAGVNMLNSKTSYVFFADNDKVAQSYKKAYDQIASGMPMTVIDRQLLTDTGEPAWQFFTQNVGQNYISDKLLIDLQTLEDQYNTLIGIPNANTQKRERLITDEVESNNAETNALVSLWLETMQDGIDKVNSMFGTDIAVEYRYKQEQQKAAGQQEEEEDGDTDTDRAE